MTTEKDRLLQSADGSEVQLFCPVSAAAGLTPHDGCALLNALRLFPRALVDAAIEGVSDTYQTEGQLIWWEHWLAYPEQRQMRLEDATGYGGMVAT